MGIRFLLVGMVATLGLDLPSAETWTHLVNAGRDWSVAQWESVQGLLDDCQFAKGCPLDVSTEAASDCRESVDHGQSVESDQLPGCELAENQDEADDQFGRLVGTMVSSFEADRVDPVALTSEPLENLEDSRGYEGIAYELNRSHDGIDTDWMTDCQAEGEDDGRHEAVLLTQGNTVEMAPEVVEQEGEEIGIDPGRLHTAVELTGQAIHAWVSVFQQPVPSLRGMR